MPTPETKLVKDITGTFHVPSYQRGYRWGEEEVKRLLNDINENGPKPYCLQPIVVKRKKGTENEYELIDGQQRLTTLYLIYQYLHTGSNGFIHSPNFNTDYDIRNETRAYLESLSEDRKEENIDFHFIYQAYDTIAKYFDHKRELRQSTMTNFNKYFDENVKVIWYEPEESEDSVSLFTRLNIGKIPLTNAELVKALFLKKQSLDSEKQKLVLEKQNEIALQWDLIETELHNDDFWYFLTKGENTGYQTRMDLILDLIAGTSSTDEEKYATFFYFARETDLWSQWKKIHATFLLLKDWYEDHELYHKIGYLIASEKCTLKQIYDLSIQVPGKTAFKAKLNEEIKDSIRLNKDDDEEKYKNYADLSYTNQTDCEKISKLLLLFNVESVRLIDNSKNNDRQNNDERNDRQNDKDKRHVGTQRFPFRIYKAKQWSLEHIHAQQSESLKKNEERENWLRWHLPYIKDIKCGADKENDKDKENDRKDLVEKLVEKIGKAIEALEKGKDLQDTFDTIQKETYPFLSESAEAPYLHSISNLALLAKDTNSALSNSLFCVKREKVIDYDNAGEYIPLCTKRVFLKYYNKEKNQLDFWGKDDREAYIKAINDILGKYLGEENKIAIELKNEG